MNLPMPARLRILRTLTAIRPRWDGQTEPASAVNLEKACRPCRRNRQGAAAVEFAIVAPIFFVMVFGMIELGRAVTVMRRETVQ